jgi:hypothetical protein
MNKVIPVNGWHQQNWATIKGNNISHIFEMRSMRRLEVGEHRVILNALPEQSRRYKPKRERVPMGHGAMGEHRNV